MNILESLENIGLKEKEAKIYLALLQLGKTTAYQVSIRSGVKKTTVYTILEELSSKGFVCKIPRVKKMLYKAEAPDKCFAMAREKLELAEKALPELLASQKGKSEKVNISFFEGLEGIKEMYKKLEKKMVEKKIEKREYFCFYGHGRDAPKEMLQYWEELSEKLRKKQIKRTVMMTEDESVKWYFENAENMGITVLGLPQEIYDTNVSFEIYDKFVQIISHRYMQGTLIENQDVASALKQIFYLVWNKYENYEKRNTSEKE